MKITMYELLGMIKDGKAPKKVKYGGIEYEFNGKDYINEFRVNLLQHLTYAEYIMTHKVEIIEEEKKIPEKLDVIAYEKCIHEDTHKEKQLALEIRDTQIAFNEIIDYLNYLKSKGDE